MKNSSKRQSPTNDNIVTPHWLCTHIAHSLVPKAFRSSQPYQILDPCAGDNRMGLAILNHVESHGINAVLTSHDILTGQNFLFTTPSQEYDIIVMNPPFSNLGAWHFIKRAVSVFLSPTGICISIIPHYIIDNCDSRKQWLADHLFRLDILPSATFAPEAPKIEASIGYFSTIENLTRFPLPKCALYFITHVPLDELTLP
jgi:hypothetical protein